MGKDTLHPFNGPSLGGKVGGDTQHSAQCTRIPQSPFKYDL